jgi:hypothetical protein
LSFSFPHKLISNTDFFCPKDQIALFGQSTHWSVSYDLRLFVQQ